MPQHDEQTPPPELLDPKWCPRHHWYDYAQGHCPSCSATPPLSDDERAATDQALRDLI